MSISNKTIFKSVETTPKDLLFFNKPKYKKTKRRRMDFFVKNLMGVTPPDRNKAEKEKK
jgi:hypothetical protein